MGDPHKVRERCVPARSLVNEMQLRRGARCRPGAVAHALPQDAGHPRVRWSCGYACFTGGATEALMIEQVPNGSAWEKH